MDEMQEDTFKNSLFDENDKDFETVYKNQCIDVLKDILDNNSVKLIYEDARQDSEIDIRKEHKECGDNNNGFGIGTTRLAGCASHLDNIFEQIKILEKMSFGEDVLKEMSLEVRKGINRDMMSLCDKTIVEIKKFKKYLDFKNEYPRSY